jgi:hypothetical protein
MTNEEKAAGQKFGFFFGIRIPATKKALAQGRTRAFV